MKLKKEYEMTFKEGLRLGIRLTQAKAYIQNARDAKRIGDDYNGRIVYGVLQKSGMTWLVMRVEGLHQSRLTNPNNLLLILVTSKCRNIYQSYHIN
jgi:hypothetical protein